MEKPHTTNCPTKDAASGLMTLQGLERIAPPGSRALHGELLVYRGGVCAGAEELPKPPSIAIRSDFYQLSLVRSGGLIGRLDEQDFRLEPGDLALVPPYHTKHLYEVAPGTEVTMLCFTGDLIAHSTLRRPSDRTLLLNSDAVHQVVLDPRHMLAWDELVGRIQYRIDGLFAHTYGRELVMNAFNELLLETGHLVQDRTDERPVRKGRKEEIAHGFLELARLHHATQRQLAFYSDRLFVTTKHLSETVKEVTGRTARQVLDALLLSEAKQLLIASGLSISEVAFRLNFEEPAHFSKFFHRTSGNSPRSYRAAH